MKEEFEKMVLAGKLKPEHVDPLVKMATSGFCLHRKWGCGQITTIDTVFGRMAINFSEKPAHSMDMGFAAGLLQPIPTDHILARKITDLPGLKQLAALNHLELIKVVLQSYGGQATLETIQQILVPDVIADDWKKWWDAAKKELKRNGHFKVPLKKSEPIVFQTEEIPLKERLLTDFDKAKGLKAKLTVGHEILKSLGEMEAPEEAVSQLVILLNNNIETHVKNQPGLALEAIFLRDSLRAEANIEPTDEELKDASVWNQIVDVAGLLHALPAAKHKIALASYKKCLPDDWKDRLLDILNDVSTKLCSECCGLIIEEGHWNDLKKLLARLISQHAASSELLLWLAKERSDSFADILTPEVFRAMLTAIERDQFNEKKSNRLADFIMSDQDLVIDLIRSADLEMIKDVTRSLQLSPSFDDMDKRSLLGRIVKQYPVVQSMISGEETKEDKRLLVSQESLDRRRAEYDQLVRKKIPANSKDIAVARSYGDLRENHEYKSAKEMQKLLMKRKAELEAGLSNASVIDFLNPNTESVCVGCVVDVTDLKAQKPETYTILGAWDLDIDNNIISYLSPLAQAAMGHKSGEEIEFDMGGEHRHYRIEAIRAARTGEPKPPASEEAE